MKEEAWYKWLVVSTLVHFIVIGAFSVQVGKSSRKIDLSSAYSVSLVGDMGGGPKSPGVVGIPKGVEAPAKEPPKPAKKAEPAKAKKAEAVKEKPVKVKPVPVPRRPEKEVVSLSKKKVPVKETPKAVKKERETATKEELADLNRRLREIRKRTDYVDITKRGAPDGSGRAAGGGGSGPAGLPFSGEGGGKPLDLVTQKYYMDIREKIMSAWGVPGAAPKKLETEITIKVRKDGRIVDVTVDKRSGNRIFDESIQRALKAVDPLPPIPASLNVDSIEIPFRFRPEEMG